MDINLGEFEYSSNDLIFQSLPWTEYNTSKPLSKFDQLLQSGWKKATENGVLRYGLEDVPYRVLPGKQGYLLQYNKKRCVERRKPELFHNLHHSFNPEKFHFGKVKPNEIVCMLKPEHEAVSVEPSSSQEQKRRSRHLVIVNISPLEYGHMLLVPDVDACLPQRLTQQAIQLSLEMILLSSHPGMRVGFNSLCGLASVNHLHLHSWYLDHQLKIEHAPVKEICCGCYDVLDSPTRAFAFQLHNSTVATVSRQIHKVTEYFHENDIANNIFFTRGTVFGEDEPSSQKRTVRIYLWPRVSETGQKNEVLKPFNVAVAELSGFVPIYVEEFYINATEDKVLEGIQQAMLPPEQFHKIKEDLKHLLVSESISECHQVPS